MAAALLIKQTCVIFRHRSYRSAARWSSWGKWKTGLTDGDQHREPQTEHRTRPGNSWLLCHFALRPPQRPVGGRDHPIRRGRLCGVRVSHVMVLKMHKRVTWCSSCVLLSVLDWTPLSSLCFGRTRGGWIHVYSTPSILRSLTVDSLFCWFSTQDCI